jgi:hypothetical protein
VLSGAKIEFSSGLGSCRNGRSFRRERSTGRTCRKAELDPPGVQPGAGNVQNSTSLHECLIASARSGAPDSQTHPTPAPQTVL